MELQHVTMLAQASQDLAAKIDDIHARIGVLPEWSLKVMWVLTIMIAVGVIVIIHRQRKIAQNQVDLAKLLEQLTPKQ